MGIIARFREKLGLKQSKKNRMRTKIGNPGNVDHNALCIRSTGLMVLMAAACWVLFSRFASRYLGAGDPLKRASWSYQQGNMFFAKGNMLQAEKSFREAVDLNPQHTFAFANLVLYGMQYHVRKTFENLLHISSGQRVENNRKFGR